MINTVKEYNALSKQYNKMLEERNSLIDDIDWQQKKIERLEDEKGDYKAKYIIAKLHLKDVKDENKELNQWHQMHKECADALYNKKMLYELLLTEISQHIGNKPSSSTYKCFRAKLDGVGIKEDE